MRIEKCRFTLDGSPHEFFLDDPITLIAGKAMTGKSALAKNIFNSIWYPFHQKEAEPDGFVDTVISSHSNIQLSFSYHDDDRFTLTDSDDTDERVLYAGPLSDDEEIMSALDLMGMKGNSLKQNLSLLPLDVVKLLFFITDEALVGNRKLLDKELLMKLFITDESSFHEVYSILHSRFENQREAKSRLTDNILTYERKIREISKNIDLADIRKTRNRNLQWDEETIRNELKNLKKKEKERREQLAILEKIQERQKDVEKLNQRLRSMREELNEELQLKNTVSELENELNTLFPNFNGAVKKDEYLEKLQSAFFRVRDLNQKIDDIKNRFSRKRTMFGRLSIAVLITSVIPLLFIFVPRLKSVVDNNTLFTILAMVLFGASSLLYLASSLISSKKSIEPLTNERNNTREELYTILKDENITLPDEQMSELYEFLMKHFQEILDYRERVHDLKALQQKLKDSDYFKTIEDELRNLEKEEKNHKEAIEEQLEKYRYTVEKEPDPATVETMIHNLKDQMTEIGGEITKKETLYKQIEEELNQYRDDSESVKELEKEKKELEEELEKKIKTGATFQYIHQVLENAISVRQENRISELTLSSLEKFHFLTLNHYRDVYDEKVFSAIIRENIFPDSVSSSLMHIIKLSVKMSLPHFLIDEKDPLPLIIDEPFQNLDDDRIERLGELCRALSEHRQIIILTQNTSIKDWGRQLVTG